MRRERRRKGRTEEGGEGGRVPNSIYATNEQEYSDIKDLIISTLCYDSDFDESVINGLNINQSRNIYSVREKNIERIVKEYGDGEAKRKYLKDQYQKVHRPFEYAPAEAGVRKGSRNRITWPVKAICQHHWRGRSRREKHYRGEMCMTG